MTRIIIIDITHSNNQEPTAKRIKNYNSTSLWSMMKEWVRNHFRRESKVTVIIRPPSSSENESEQAFGEEEYMATPAIIRKQAPPARGTSETMAAIELENSNSIEALKAVQESSLHEIKKSKRLRKRNKNLNSDKLPHSIVFGSPEEGHGGSESPQRGMQSSPVSRAPILQDGLRMHPTRITKPVGFPPSIMSDPHDLIDVVRPAQELLDRLAARSVIDEAPLADINIPHLQTIHEESRTPATPKIFHHAGQSRMFEDNEVSHTAADELNMALPVSPQSSTSQSPTSQNPPVWGRRWRSESFEKMNPDPVEPDDAISSPILSSDASCSNKVMHQDPVELNDTTWSPSLRGGGSHFDEISAGSVSGSDGEVEDEDVDPASVPLPFSPMTEQNNQFWTMQQPTPARESSSQHLWQAPAVSPPTNRELATRDHEDFIPPTRTSRRPSSTLFAQASVITFPTRGQRQLIPSLRLGQRLRLNLSTIPQLWVPPPPPPRELLNPDCLDGQLTIQRIRNFLSLPPTSTAAEILRAGNEKMRNDLSSTKIRLPRHFSARLQLALSPLAIQARREFTRLMESVDWRREDLVARTSRPEVRGETSVWEASEDQWDDVEEIEDNDQIPSRNRLRFIRTPLTSAERKLYRRRMTSPGRRSKVSKKRLSGLRTEIVVVDGFSDDSDDSSENYEDEEEEKEDVEEEEVEKEEEEQETY